MKPDLVAIKGNTTDVIDVQVVGTGMELFLLHDQKTARNCSYKSGAEGVKHYSSPPPH